MSGLIASLFAVVYSEDGGTAADFSRAKTTLERHGVPYETARPSPPAPSAPTLLARVIQAYEDLRLGDARRDLDDAWAEVQKTGGAGLDESALADLQLHRALVLHALGDDGAWDAFVRAAALDPTRVLDPARFSPSAVATFQRAKDAVRAMERGSLELRTDPSDASVSIDGRSAHRAEMLPYGEHCIRVEAPGFAPHGECIRLAEPQRTMDVRLPLLAPPTLDAARLRSGGATQILIVTAGRRARFRLVALTDGSVRRDRSTAPSRIEEEIAEIARPRPSSRADPQPAPTWYRRPWIWVASAVVAGSIAAVLAVQADDDVDRSHFTPVIDNSSARHPP